jgi:hypothetical protein
MREGLTCRRWGKKTKSKTQPLQVYIIPADVHEPMLMNQCLRTDGYELATRELDCARARIYGFRKHLHTQISYNLSSLIKQIRDVDRSQHYMNDVITFSTLSFKSFI